MGWGLDGRRKGKPSFWEHWVRLCRQVYVAGGAKGDFRSQEGNQELRQGVA
jgi:hypothetical protein